MGDTDLLGKGEFDHLTRRSSCWTSFTLVHLFHLFNWLWHLDALFGYYILTGDDRNRDRGLLANCLRLWSSQGDWLLLGTDLRHLVAALVGDILTVVVGAIIEVTIGSCGLAHF